MAGRSSGHCWGVRFREDHATEINFRPPDTTAREIRYENRSLYAMSEADRRRLLRTEWGVVHQHPLDGLRRQVSAGGNIGERLMATGARHYGDIRATAQKWLEEVEIPANRIDDLPTTFPAACSNVCRLPATW